MHNNACMNKKEAIDQALTDIDSDFMKALVEPARIEILKLLILNGTSDVKTLAEKMPQDRSVISRHLTFMEKAGLVKSQKEGRHVIYFVDGQNALQKAENIVLSMKKCFALGCC